MSLFKRDTTIFKDEEVLREDYQPDHLVARQDEINKFKDALQPVINNVTPWNIFLYGETGAGKTAATKYLTKHLKQDAENHDDLDLTIVEMNCVGLNTSYQVAINLVNKLKQGENISTTGHPQKAVFRMLFEALDDIGGTILIVLDEIDNIGNSDDLLYEIPRARSNGHLSEAKPGIIGISNNLRFYENLSPKVKDSLCEEEIFFSPYNASELIKILKDRVKDAFYEGTLEEGVIELCSAKSANDTGSARQAIKILYKAGKISRRENSDKVTQEHVEQATIEISQRRLEDGVEGLTPQGKRVLLSLVDKSMEGKEYIPTKQIYNRYEELSTKLGFNALTYRRVHDHLSNMSMLGILDTKDRNQGKGGGIQKLYKLDVPLSRINTVLEEDDVTREYYSSKHYA